jgi:RNA-directed DNA polymerase
LHLVARSHSSKAVCRAIAYRRRSSSDSSCRQSWYRFAKLYTSFHPGKHRLRKDGHEYLGASPSKKSVSKLRQKVADLLVSQNVSPWTDVRDDLNRILRGWSNYFGYGTRMKAYRAVDHHVYERVRNFLRHRHKVHSRGSSSFSDAVVFGKLGVLRLRDVHLGPLP